VIFHIDHVELFVPDRYEAAAWYERVLGLTILPDYEHWAADPRGPLMISGDEGSTKLALFAGESQASRETAGFHRVAFRVDAADFMRYLRRLGELRIQNQLSDHDKAYSVYFADPYGHRLEVTTYDYDRTRAFLADVHG
jgi:catechol 2,3-dioxygenase-like lactoylglutathione lyase family enzyme